MVSAPPADWLEAPTLTGRFVRLEALSAAHAAGIARHATTETVSFLSRGGPADNTPQEWAGYVQRLNAIPNRVNFAVLIDDQVAGRISYSEIRPHDLWLEIGTMLSTTRLPFRDSADSASSLHSRLAVLFHILALLGLSEDKRCCT